ncbi:cadherin-like domain-containing protein, partial [Sulfurimonas sp.]|nr:cadherin-like domain-containing protein [Sulfurimonas sp.]
AVNDAITAAKAAVTSDDTSSSSDAEDKLADALSKANTYVANANTLVAEANEAVTAANDAKSAADTAVAEAEDALASAQHANEDTTDEAAALSAAQTAQATAATSVSDAATAKIAADAELVDANALKTEVTQIADALDDTLSTNEDTTLEITASDLLANDTGSATITSVNSSSDTHGSVTLNNDGTITYTPDANYEGSASFTYTTTDANGDTDTATATVNVNSVNDAVSLVSDTDTDANTIAEDVANGTEVGITAKATDIDGETVTYSIVDSNGDAVTNGAFEVNASTGVVTVRDNTQIDYESSSSHDVIIKATSVDGTSSTETFSVGVSDVSENVAATITVSPVDTLTEGSASVGTKVADVTTNDADGDTLTLTVSDTTNYAINSDGDVVLTAAGVAIVDAGNDLPSFTVTVNDGTVDTVSGTVTPATTTDINDPLSLTVTAVTTLTEDDVSSGTTVATSTASDEDGSAITFTIDDTSNYSINSTTGEVTLTATGAAVVNSGADLPNFNVTAASTTGLTSSDTVSVNPANTTDVNDESVVSGAVDLGATNEDTSVIINESDLLANVTDEDNDTLSVQNISVDASKGTIVDNNNGTFTFTPASDVSADDVTFSFDVSDGTETTPATATLDITAVADTPTGVSIDVSRDGSNVVIADDTNILAGNDFSGVDTANGVSYSMSFDYTGSDAVDVYFGDTLVGSIAENSGNTTHTFDVTGATTDQDFTFKDVNNADVSGISNAYMAPLENMIEYDVDIDASLSDTDGSETLAVTLSGLPDGATLAVGEAGSEAGTWVIQTSGNDVDLNDIKMYVPESADTFDVTVTATATDGTSEASATDSASVVDVSLNTAATSSDDTVTAYEDTTLVLSTNDFGNYSDADGEAFAAVQITDVPDNGTLKLLGQDTPITLTDGYEVSVSDIELGNLVFIPNDNFSGDANFNFRVGDGNSFSDNTYETTVNVQGVADAPTVSIELGTMTQDTTPGSSTTLEALETTQNVTESVSITNASFESSNLDNGKWDSNVDSWDQSGSAGDYEVKSKYYNDGEITGDNVAWIDGNATISQILGENLAEDTTYELSIDIGDTKKDNHGSSSDFSVKIYAGDEVVATLTEDDITRSDGTMTTGTFSIDTSTLASDFSGFGEALKIQIENYDNSRELHVDNLNMTKTYDKVGGNWSGSGVSESNDVMTISQDSAATQSFNFGAENAGKTVNIEFDAIFQEGWSTLGGGDDFYVNINGTTTTISDFGTDYSADESRSFTGNDGFSAVIQNDGTVSLTLSTDTTRGQETLDISNFSISGTTTTDPIVTNIYPIDIETTLGSDQDGSETLGDVALSGVPADATLFANGVEVTVTNGSADLSQAQVTAGNITMELPSTSDQSFTLDASVTSTESGNSAASTSSASIENTVVDDAPEVTNESVTLDVENSTASSQDTNIVMVLDLSGSMTMARYGGEVTLDDGTVTTRLAVAKDAINDMIDTYDGLGDVNVKLTTFSSSGTSSAWMSASDAKDAITALESGGSTNYEDAVYETYNNYTEPAADKTVGFFISDGEPTSENSEGRDQRGNVGRDSEDGWIDSSYQDGWTNFVNSNLDELNVVGIGTGITNTTYLDQLAEGANSNVTVNTMVVKDVEELEGNITPNVSNVSGTVSDNIDYGADGKGGIESITIDGTTYLGSNASDVSSLSSGVSTNDGGKLTFNFSTGDYTYSSISTVSSDYVETFAISVADADGDTATLNLSIDVNNITADPSQSVTTTYANDVTSDITTGDGHDTLTMNDDIESGAVISTGLGDDTVTVNDDFDDGTINTGAGDDTVEIKHDLGDVGESGHINTGSGDDKIIIDNFISGSIDGGEGLDTLVFDDGGDINMSALDDSISNIETIDLGTGDQNITSLTTEDVLNVTDDDNVLRIDGDGNDEVNLDSSEWTLGNFKTDAETGQQYQEVTGEVGDETVTLEISTDVTIDQS